MVDLYSDNMHNAPFMHLKKSQLIHYVDCYMSMYSISIREKAMLEPK